MEASQERFDNHYTIYENEWLVLSKLLMYKCLKSRYFLLKVGLTQVADAVCNLPTDKSSSIKFKVNQR
jgi:hypothetical protein